MDLSAFSEPNYTALDYVNKLFRSVNNTDDNEAQICSIISKLQLLVQQVNSSLEESSQLVLQNMPKVMYEAELIQKEAATLKEQMFIIKEEISKIERSTESSVTTLEKLDSMKSSLMKAKQALQEADNWTVLANDIEDIFESHNIESIVSKITAMQQSLVVLENINDFKNRQLQLEGYKNRLEATISPLLVKAFTTGNIEESQKYVTFFNSMERLPQLVQYYCQCQKGSLCHQWNNIVELDQEHSVLEWLKAFYDILLNEWQSQVKWGQTVFKSISMLPGLYCEVLETLSERFTSSIESALKRHLDPLPFLILLKESSKHFWGNMKAAFIQQGWDDKSEESLRLYQAIMNPYIPYISNYGYLEERHLLTEIAPPTTAIGTDLVDSVQSLGQRNAHVFIICQRAIGRCIDFTESLGFVGLISAFQFCLMKYTEEYKEAIRQIDTTKSVKDEWTMFKICLTLLQRIGDVISEVKKLDREIKESVLKASEKRESVDKSCVLLNKEAQEDYNQFIHSLRHDSNVLGEVLSRLDKMNAKAYQCSVNVMYVKISTIFDEARTYWLEQDGMTHPLPDYSYAPLEYITQIGEYLMTLPQHLEPILTGRDSDLMQTLPPSELLLGAIASRTSAQYVDLILSLPHVSPSSSKQLSVDIGYLGNVFEDIGCNLSDSLHQVCCLLKLPTETYQTLSVGFSPKLVATVRHLRNITGS